MEVNGVFSKHTFLTVDKYISWERGKRVLKVQQCRQKSMEITKGPRDRGKRKEKRVWNTIKDSSRDFSTIFDQPSLRKIFGFSPPSFAVRSFTISFLLWLHIYTFETRVSVDFTAYIFEWTKKVKSIFTLSL